MACERCALCEEKLTDPDSDTLTPEGWMHYECALEWAEIYPCYGTAAWIVAPPALHRRRKRHDPK